MAKTSDVSLPIETELKLQLLPEHIDRFRRSNVLSKSEPDELELDNVYYDTTDHLLQRHAMALRLRKVGGRWLQTLKTQGDSRGAVRSRGEWETPARVVRGQGRIDVTRFEKSPLLALLHRHKGPALVPMFRTHVTRTVWSIQRGSITVEVALDVGRIEVAHQQQKLSEAICEIELELKGGAQKDESAALLEVALELINESGKVPLGLIPVTRSKAERGFQLAAQKPAPALKASAKGFIKDVTSRSTQSTTLRAVVAHGLAVLTANVECLLRYDDPEYVHQSRVALRRVRSAIRLLDRGHSDVPRALLDELRWFASALGDARDWDVIADETLPLLTDAIGVESVRALVAKAEVKRQQARASIRKAALSTRYAALVLRGERWCLTPAPLDSPLLSDTAPAALQRASKKLFTQARFFAALTPVRRHQVRILAKRLRYALDLSVMALPKQAAVRYVAALSELQDALGQLNDASVATAVLPQLTRSLRIKKSVQRRLASMEPDRVVDIESRLLKLSSLERPW